MRPRWYSRQVPPSQLVQRRIAPDDGAKTGPLHRIAGISQAIAQSAEGLGPTGRSKPRAAWPPCYTYILNDESVSSISSLQCFAVSTVSVSTWGLFIPCTVLKHRRQSVLATINVHLQCTAPSAIALILDNSRSPSYHLIQQYWEL